jgi:hypothetical protein
MIKLTAACCGYTVRTTRKWLDERYPLCPTASPCTRTNPPATSPDMFKRPRSWTSGGV